RELNPAVLTCLLHGGDGIRHFHVTGVQTCALPIWRDLGNAQPGDGRRYKGRGPIQLTGRANYRAAGKALGLPLEEQPELAAMPEHGFRIAAWYWTMRKLNPLADQGNFLAITVAINGGLNGYADRVRRRETAKKVLGQKELPLA